MLNGIIGHYFLYTDTAAKADDIRTMHEEILKKMIVDNFGRQRSTFLDMLQCEDYED